MTRDEILIRKTALECAVEIVTKSNKYDHRQDARNIKPIANDLVSWMMKDEQDAPK